jgi:hypothetical protein
MFKKTAVALSVVTLATGAAALPEAQARDYTSVQVASCAANPCNPCAAAACNPCNPCLAASCNPCNPCSPCSPCAVKKNPCGGCNPCNPCAATNN